MSPNRFVGVKNKVLFTGLVIVSMQTEIRPTMHYIHGERDRKLNCSLQ